ncbi:hypothetical protein ABZS99_03865 [Streptomyces sp. NPDC005463]|uniref:hypothetical protein n=1 Tax=Streptomyces sp. NPDC005463 TaxID=3154465 RepID=UPI0033AB0F94
MSRRAPAGPWPAPETAYANAPSIVSEIGWTARTARTIATGSYDAVSEREFWLRKAGLLDRIALSDGADNATSDAADLATRAAQRLMELDGAVVICDPRHYLRQQYAHWAKDQ